MADSAGNDVMASSTRAPMTRSPGRGGGGGGADDLEFSCPAQICDCYILRPGGQIWLNCTVPRLQGTEQQKALFRGIPAHRSALMTIMCSTPARSYLYDDMVSQLSALQELKLLHCKFHDIPRNVFRGLSQLQNLLIEGANLLGHIDPDFASHLPKLRLLQIIKSRVTFLPPLCGSGNLHTLNVSYNNIADFDHAGVNCGGSRPLGKLRILNVNYNHISKLPTWLGSSLPSLLQLSCGDNAVREVDEQFCQGLPDLKFLDLSSNLMRDVHKVKLYNCSQLRILALGQNDLGAVPPGSLESMLYLQTLYLFGMGLDDSLWDRLSHLEFLNVLELQNNSLTTVPPHVLQEFSNLMVLNLSHNTIYMLPKKSFLSQYHLKVLDLSSNGMRELPFQVFSSLITLKELNLANNSIADVDQTTFTGLRSLVKLDFSDNFLRFIPEQAFATVSSLQRLDLSRNRLAVIGNNAFNRMGSLVRVYLGDNRLHTIPSMSGLDRLEEVDLGHNNLTSLPSTMFTGLRNLSKVVLRGNGFHTLSTKIFHDCRQLRHLDLAHNQLPGLSPMHFVNVDNLQYLDLSHNDVFTIGTMFKNIRLRTLLLSNNRLQKLLRGDVSSTLEVLDVSNNQISHISPFTFAAAVNVRQVNLTFNELTSLSANTMEISFSQMQFSQPLFYLRGNPLRCDCDLGWLKDWSLDRIPSSVMPLPEFGDLDNLLCHSMFVGSNRTNSMPLTQVPRNEFLCSYDRKCGEGCVCCGFDMCYCNSICPKACTCYIGDSRLSINRINCANADLDFLPEGIPEAATEIYLDGNNLGTLQALTFLGHGQTSILRLNDSDIHYIENNTFRGMNSLRELHLNNNSLRVVFVGVFKDLIHLEELYLQDNEISFIEEGAFALMMNLRVVNLERNHLAMVYFTDFTLIPSLTSIHLMDNPWNCIPNFTCPFFRFLTNTSSVVKDLKNLLCYDADTPAMKAAADRSSNGTLIMSLPLNQCGENMTELAPVINETQPLQSTPVRQDLSTLIVVSILSVFLLSALVIIYINRHLLEVWCFTKFGWRVFKMAPSGREDVDRPYDAFVSYSHMDEEFVAQELAPRLENGYKSFRLCLHYRDFPVGASIAETIVRSVESSQRTIILVSNNFLASEWCKFEFQTAHQQVLTERKNRVILVLLHDLDDSKLDQTLRLYMRTRTYLKYDDPWFWEKLMFAMPDKKVEKFERLPSNRDLEYVARFGRTPSKTPNSTPATTPRHVHVNCATGQMVRNDTYEVPVSGSGTYERVNESMSISSSLYNGGSLGAASGHYEEVTPRAFLMRPVHDVCTCHHTLPPPLPPLPRMGLLPHEEVKNSPGNSSREALSKEENWV
ncbi:hypothetical protein ACOMHN_028949 [Nucella lapillus]